MNGDKFLMALERRLHHGDGGGPRRKTGDKFKSGFFARIPIDCPRFPQIIAGREQKGSASASETDIPDSMPGFVRCPKKPRPEL